MKGCTVLLILFVSLLLFAPHIYSETTSSQEFQHSPYADKTCNACHSSDNPSAKDISDETPALCYNCHNQYSKAFMHSPVSVGDCLICHDPHKSKFKFFLKQRVPDLCYLCHDQIQKLMTDNKTVKHAPAKDNCAGCHNPHASDTSNVFLQQDMTTLCTDCHIKSNVPMQNYIAKVANKHQPVEEGGRCAHCHAPHASPFQSLLRAEPMDLCLKCHNKEVTAYDGEVLANMEEILKNNPSWHGPIREKNCSGCHNPHGSNYFRILKQEYPKDFYTEKFSLDSYKLCFSCHESNILKDKETTTLTNFRDGKRNLHFLHVNRSEKGRTCRACHETHASTHPKHIRDSVPFGQVHWLLELKYQPEYTDTKTGAPCSAPSATCIETGGSCVACHARKPYNYKKSN